MRRPVASADLPDWLQPHLRWITMPSWVLSIMVHLMLWGALLATARLPGCRPDVAGGEMADQREIGLSIRPSGEPAPGPLGDGFPITGNISGAGRPSSDSQPSSTPDSTSSPISNSVPQISSTPPVALNLPSGPVSTLPTPAVIGPGQSLPRSLSGSNSILDPGRSGGSRSGGGTGGGGTGDGGGGGFGTGLKGGTTFLGIKDTGRRFAYVIDSSSSMADYGALRVAKMELLSSLEQLTDQHQFEVIFANSSQILTLDPGRFGLFRGTDSHRLEVRQQVMSIPPDSGTDHFGALQTALKHEPDVLFYLTDAGDPPLSFKQLEQIRKLNRGTRIHAIEFGMGTIKPDRTGKFPPNFLTKLAAQNDGHYTYRDVTQFTGR